MEPTQRSQEPRRPAPPTPGKSGEERGKTVIADEVVSIIARVTAEQVAGVHQIGDSTLRGVFSRMGRGGGIASEVGLKEAAVDLNIVVEYGFPIHEVAQTLREKIIEAVEMMTGRHVVEVNVHVVDVHIPRVEQSTKRNLE